MDSFAAAKLLWKVQEDVRFHFCNGKSASSLQEFLFELSNLDQKDFSHHVSNSHNDFSNWLRDIVGDNTLAKDMFSAELHKSVALTKARVTYLERSAKMIP